MHQKHPWILSLFMAAWCALSFGGTQALAREASVVTAGPAIWTVQGEKGTVDILGSVHLLKPGTRWFDGPVKRALDRADSLTLETVLDADGHKAIQEITVKEGLYPAGQSLQTNVSPEIYAHAVSEARKLGIQEQQIQHFRPWYLSIVLATNIVQGMGFDAKAGVEQTLTEEARLRGLKVQGLETPSEQILLLARTSPKVQVAMLEDTMRQTDEVKDTLDQMTAAWTRGDLAVLEKLLVDKVKENPDLYEIVIVKRNKAWVPKIKEMLETPGRHLVVVGAAHLIGDDSVIKNLEAEGLRVRRQGM